MGRLFSSFVLVGFVLISAFANFGVPHAIAGNVDDNRLGAQASGALMHVADDAENLGPMLENSAGTQDGGCRCNSDTDTKKFTCGVTLALIDEADVSQPSAVGRSRIVGLDTNGPKTYVDLLKRPPRSEI